MISESRPLEPGGTLRSQAWHMKRKRGRKEKEKKERNETVANPPVALSLRCFASFAVWKL